jgi:ABC-type antimicrobial peptide transport system permease subunit
VVGEGAASSNHWALGSSLLIYGEAFTISGIYRAPGTGFTAIWMTMEAAKDLFGGRNPVQALTLMLAPGADPAAVSSELQKSAALAGTYSVFLEDSYTQGNGRFVRDIYGLINLFSLIALLAVPLISYSLTLLNLAENLRELGILRALGFSHRAVRGFLLLRALTLAFGAYLLGLVMALVYIAIRQAGGPFFVMGFPFKFNLNGWHALLYLVITLVFALAGTWLSSGKPLKVAVNELLKD